MSGYCECGCGEPAPRARQKRSDLGLEKGDPLRFVAGHAPRARGVRPETFWPKVDQSAGAEACWPWTGLIVKDGYGRFGSSRTGGPAHRLAYQYARGQIPSGLYVLHLCDNPACCNPAHLMVGTQAENARQCVERGRKHVGSMKRTAKLSYEKARQIRDLYASGGWTHEKLAERFGVGSERIQAVVTGRAWKQAG